MANDLSARIKDLLDQRIALETKLQNEKGELSDAASGKYDDAYAALTRQLATAFKQTSEDSERVTIMHNGRVLKHGTPGEIENDAEVQAIYMGSRH